MIKVLVVEVVMIDIYKVELGYDDRKSIVIIPAK
jgi:hypothetical protein